MEAFTSAAKANKPKSPPPLPNEDMLVQALVEGTLAAGLTHCLPSVHQGNKDEGNKVSDEISKSDLGGSQYFEISLIVYH